MTTSKVRTMDTDGIIEEPRSLSELLKLDTYQGMTDAEINSIIKHYNTLAYKEARLDLDKENVSASLNKLVESTLSAREKAQETIDNCNFKPTYRRVFGVEYEDDTSGEVDSAETQEG